MKLAIACYRKQYPFLEPIELGQDLRTDIERVFLSDEAIHPGSDLMETIGRPRNFPVDIVGKLFYTKLVV